MDRFEWSDFTFQSWEAHVTHQTGVALYDGNVKVNNIKVEAGLQTTRPGVKSSPGEW